MTQDAPADDASAFGRDEAVGHAPASVDTLKLAMRRARADDAERAGARAELRAARLTRLEMLQDALQPLAGQIPVEVDMFDIALAPSPSPRLFIDMIGFVEMGRDGRLYVFNQDTRHGRILVAESESLDAMVDAVTNYVARRLLERDKALAAEARGRPSASVQSSSLEVRAPAWQPREPSQRPTEIQETSVAASRRGAPLRWVGIAFAFLIDLLGAIAFFLILGAVCWYAWSRAHGAS